MLGLDSERIPRNYAATQFAEALGKAWAEYNNDRSTLLQFENFMFILSRLFRKCQHLLTYFSSWLPSAVVMMVVQPEERNMYDQYWLINHLMESYPFVMCFHFPLL